MTSTSRDSISCGTRRSWCSVGKSSKQRCVRLAGALAALTSACDISISTSPPLTPAFDPSIRDYVIRCTDTPVRVSLTGSESASARVDGRVVRGGTTTQVAVTSGEAFTMEVPHAGGRYSVRCLPADFPQYAIDRTKSPQAEWYIVTPSLSFRGPPPVASPQYVAVFDDEGVPMWWSKSMGTSIPLDAKLLPNGNLAWLHLNGEEGGSEERRLDGTLVRTLNTVGGPADHHEILLLTNGNYVLARGVVKGSVDLTSCGGAEAGTVLDNEVQEISPDGVLVWSWNALAHIPVRELQWADFCRSDVSTAQDVYHINSIEADGDAFVVSFRHLNAVYKISRSTGQIIWKLGGKPCQESLRVFGDPVVDSGDELFSGQHDARRLPDGTWTVHDNRTQASAVPRALRFRIDEASATAMLLESVSADVATSECCGSARKLSTGDWVTSWGNNPSVTELAANGSLVFRINFTEGLFSYRADAVMPGVLKRSALLDAMNTQYPRAIGAGDAPPVVDLGPRLSNAGE